MLPEFDISDLSNFWEEVRRCSDREASRKYIEGILGRPRYPEFEIPDEVIPADVFENIKSKEPEPEEQQPTNQKEDEMSDEKISIETKSMQEMADALGSAIVGGVTEVLERYRQPVVVSLPDAKELKAVKGKTHRQFSEVLTAIGAGLNVFLVGEAGSGKTHLVEQCAETLGLKFYCISVCAQTSASVLLGYMNANGEYVRTLFREAYENGGVFLLDEIDNGNPNVLAVLNSALANNVCAFPDKMVKKHKDFIVCASGNTYGTGADRKYVGRLEIDAATLDRFAFIELNYDEVLERDTCGNEQVANLVQYLRANARKLQSRHIISPRASIFISRLVAADANIDNALKACVFKGMDEDTINKVKGDKNKFSDLVKAIYDHKKKQKAKPVQTEIKIEVE